jgi:hypothetical protein
VLILTVAFIATFLLLVYIRESLKRGEPNSGARLAVVLLGCAIAALYVIGVIRLVW